MAPYQQMLHSGGIQTWERSDPIIPATGLPMISGGQSMDVTEAEVLAGINKEELSKCFFYS